MKSKNMFIRPLYMVSLVIYIVIILISCNGCKTYKTTKNGDFSDVSHVIQEQQVAEVDTTTQTWQDKNYYRGTKIPLPDSLKTREGLGIRFWYNLPKNENRPIIFDNVGDPRTEVTRINFVDSISSKTTYSLIVYEHNPYKDLPFKRITGERLMKVDGIIRYDLSSKTKEELKSFLLGMGVNIDTVTTKIVGAEVMTGNNSPDERTALANSYAIQVLDKEGQIIANQTTYKIYDIFGKQTGEIKENGHGLYQFAITKDGKHLAASFGGRYGCKSGQYIQPYFKIFKTINGEVIHQEDMEFSDGVSSCYNYFCVVFGGRPRIGYEMSIYDLDTKMIAHGNIPLIKKEGWKRSSVILNGKEVSFADSYFTNKPFTVKK